MKKTFLSIGECMVEMAPTASGDYHMGFAGDTLNTAWYARQTLGPDWEVAYFTAVGQDAVSERMADFISDAGIGTDLIRRLPDKTVGLYLIQLDNGERSFAYWRSDAAARQLAADSAALEAALATAGLVFFSGITLAILPATDRKILLSAIAGARRNGATIAFDPNLRPRLWQDPGTMRNQVMAAAAVSDILLPSFEDEASAFGDQAPEDTARRYAGCGARLVVVKNGPGDILALDQGEITRFTPAPVTGIVDTTAAGDSFNAAFLASYLASADVPSALPPALAAGADLASRVITRRGALIDIANE